MAGGCPPQCADGRRRRRRAPALLRVGVAAALALAATIAARSGGDARPRGPATWASVPALGGEAPPAPPEPEAGIRMERLVRFRRGKERRLRDWHEPMPDCVAKQLDQAITYFSNSVRVPAVLIAGQAGNMLYRMTELPGVGARRQDAAMFASRRSCIYVALYRAHLLLTAYTVCSQLTAVLLCSTAHAQILDIGRDVLALEPTALDLVIRHVEFEYVMVRAAFFSGLVAFLLAISFRLVAYLGAGPRGTTTTGERELLLCMAVAAMSVSTLSWWFHIYNEDTDVVWQLVRGFLRLIRKRLRHRSLATLSAVSAAVSCVFALAAFCGLRLPCGNQGSRHHAQMEATAQGTPQRQEMGEVPGRGSSATAAS